MAKRDTPSNPQPPARAGRTDPKRAATLAQAFPVGEYPPSNEADVQANRVIQDPGRALKVSLQRSARLPADQITFWYLIKRSTEAISFDEYDKFMDLVLCQRTEPRPDDPPQEDVDNVKSQFEGLRPRRILPYTDTDAYRLLKVATEAFLMVNCGVSIPGFANEDLSALDQDKFDDAVKKIGLEDSVEWTRLWNSYRQALNGSAHATIPYFALVRRKLKDQLLKPGITGMDDADLGQGCLGVLQRKLTRPCFVELIWSYWMEEGMLVQTMKVLARRFQNIRTGARDPLANMEIDPLRSINNLLWGFIQDEQHRLSLPRRAYEYDHHYGIRLVGKAVPKVKGADSRSKFLEAFHNLLHTSAMFYRDDDDTTVIADGFPLLNALKDVHLLLTQGAHNQFGDLPTTARIELLMMQWVLARPEFREFLPTRNMVVYPEAWMDRVDAMKKLQGWTDTSIAHFGILAKFGEQILLSIRLHSWGKVEDPNEAALWARFWRAQIQGYVHSYRAATGVDLTADRFDNTMPSMLLRNRLAIQLRSN